MTTKQENNLNQSNNDHHHFSKFNLREFCNNMAIALCNYSIKSPFAQVGTTNNLLITRSNYAYSQSNESGEGELYIQKNHHPPSDINLLDYFMYASLYADARRYTKKKHSQDVHNIACTFNFFAAIHMYILFGWEDPKYMHIYYYEFSRNVSYSRYISDCICCVVGKPGRTLKPEHL